MLSKTEETTFNLDQENQALFPQKRIMNEVKFYSLALLACCLFGTKLLLLELAHFTKIWIFFIEHVVICLSAVLFFCIYFFFVKERLQGYASLPDDRKGLTVFKKRAILICALISGGCNALGNVSIIFAIKFARDAGSSSSAINSILMLNILIALMVGLLMFGEKHSLTQYLGGILIIGAVLLITFERSFDAPGTHTHFQNNLHYTSIFFTLVTCAFWSLMIISTKYCCFYYEVDIIEYSSLAMTLSGFIGSLTGIPIYFFGTPFHFMYQSMVIKHICFAMMAGLFTTMGQFSYFAAVNIGSVEVGQLFVNMKPIVQLIEEAIFLFIFPTFWAFVGIFIAVIGAVMVILGKHEGQHQHPDGYRSDDKEVKR